LRQHPRVPCEGSDAVLACLAGRGPDGREVLLGSIARGTTEVRLVLRGLGIGAGRPEVRRIPADGLEGTAGEEALQRLGEGDFEIRAEAGTLQVLLPRVAENEVYQIRFPGR